MTKKKEKTHLYSLLLFLCTAYSPPKPPQNWIRYDGYRFFFPGGETMFPNGADAYIDDIGKRINLRDGSIRTALDTACGALIRGLLFMVVGQPHKPQELKMAPRKSERANQEDS